MLPSGPPHIDKVVVVGASAGGLNALQVILSRLGGKRHFPILICKHLGVGDEKGMVRLLTQQTGVKVWLAQDKMQVRKGNVYLAPGNYHLQAEHDGTLSLSIDERVCHSRPAIDVLFETTADVYGDKVTAIILTGANRDGAAGVKAVKAAGGTVIVQSPESAEVGIMPKAAIETGCTDQILTLAGITKYLQKLENS